MNPTKSAFDIKWLESDILPLIITGFLPMLLKLKIIKNDFFFFLVNISTICLWLVCLVMGSLFFFKNGSPYDFGLTSWHILILATEVFTIFSLGYNIFNKNIWNKLWQKVLFFPLLIYIGFFLVVDIASGDKISGFLNPIAWICMTIYGILILGYIGIALWQYLEKYGTNG